MLKNYFKIAWRNLWKNKFYTILNISGLAIGLAVAILIFIWVQDELSYDNFHRQAANIYKINSHLGKGTSAQVWSNAPAPLAVFCKESVPEVKAAVRIKERENQLLFNYRDHRFLETSSAFVDPSFFAVFDFVLLKGNPVRPFLDAHSVILSASVAKKYFGNENPMGKILVADNKENFTVSAVVEDFPENSSIHYDLLFPMSLFASNFQGNGNWKTIDQDLGNFMYSIFLQLRVGASADVVGRKITRIFRNKKGPDGKDDFFSLQSLQTLHLTTADGGSTALQTVRIFLIVGILILLIACINYVNLSTARSVIRSKEVSIRKIVGAARFQLLIQFFVESLVLFALSSLVALLMVFLLFPMYNELSGKHLAFSLSNPNIWMVVCIACTATLLMSSVYPALLLSSFRPLEALKGKLTMRLGNASFRKILVVTQFVFSVGLIINTIVISDQLRYIREKDLGYNKEHVFTIALRDELHDHFDAVRNELLKQPGVFGVAGSDDRMIGGSSTTGDTYWEGKEADRMFLIHPTGIDPNFIPLLKMQLVAGKNFTGENADSMHVILNETAVKQAGIKDPIGKSFTLWQTKGTIIGIVKDFNYASLKQAIEPAIYYWDPQSWILYIKTNGKQAPQVIESAQKIWKKYSPEFPFNYTFLDETYNQLYKAEQRTGFLFEVFAAVAIIISCLGLFGLATFTAQVKTKEIGIRKVLGATVLQITHLLAKEFIGLVLLAFLIAAPFAWWLSNKWLQDFAYRIEISWWIFSLTAFLAILITIITVSSQAIRAALANPVKSLRSE